MPLTKSKCLSSGLPRWERSIKRIDDTGNPQPYSSILHSKDNHCFLVTFFCGPRFSFHSRLRLVTWNMLPELFLVEFIPSASRLGHHMFAATPFLLIHDYRRTAVRQSSTGRSR